MSKLRSVNTKFWDDPFVVELSPTEKLLFLYLITNSLTNILGVYEISLRKISFDTGIDLEKVRKGLERFGTVRKVYFEQDYIILPNWLKNQKLNTNMRIAVEREFEGLPNWLKEKIISNSSEGLENGYQSILKGLQTLRKDEGEDKTEREDEKEGDKFIFKKAIIDLGVQEKIASDWLKVRSKKKAANTETAFNGIKSQIEKSGLSANECIKIAAEKSWSGFNHKWLETNFNPSDTRTQPDMENFDGNF